MYVFHYHQKFIFIVNVIFIVININIIFVIVIIIIIIIIINIIIEPLVLPDPGWPAVFFPTCQRHLPVAVLSSAVPASKQPGALQLV